MRRARDESGARLFRIEEFLMPQQIAAFFSQLVVQSRQKVADGEILEEDVTANEEESNFDEVRKVLTKTSISSTRSCLTNTTYASLFIMKS